LRLSKLQAYKGRSKPVQPRGIASELRPDTSESSAFWRHMGEVLGTLREEGAAPEGEVAAIRVSARIEATHDWAQVHHADHPRGTNYELTEAFLSLVRNESSHGREVLFK
jgi:hypothetical protein